MEDEVVVKISTQEFAAKIKAKYPQYEDIDDAELTQKIINKYPEYKDQVDLSQGGASDVGKPQGEMNSTQLSEESVSDGGGLTETVGASESQEPQRKFGLTQEAVDQAATDLQSKESAEDEELKAIIKESDRFSSLDIPTLNKTIETSREKLSELESMSSETQQKADEEIGRINDLYTNGEMSRENYESNYATLKQGYEAAGESISTEFNAYSSEYTRAIADKQALRAEKGTLTGALIKGVIEGSGSVIEGALRIGAMGGGVVFNLPQEAADAFNENITEKITPLLMIGIQADAVLKESRGMEFNPIISAAKTTDEYIQKRQEDSFAFSATYGVARSLPAMVTGGGGLIAQAYNDGYDIVDAAAGDKLSNQQKDAFALTFGVAQGLLERVGLQTVLGKGAASKLATEAIEAISKKGMKLNPTNIEGIIMNRLKPVLRGTAGEGATGAMQETSAIAIEEITDALSGEDFFDNEGIAQMTGRVLEGAALEAAGGFIMTSPSALVRSKAERISKEDYEAAKIVTSGEAFPETIDYIDAKEKSGELTTEEAAELKQDVSKFAEVDRQIPENLDVEKKIKAFKLIQEKKELESEIEEKDKALTVPQQDRIKAINEELTNIVAPQETTKTETDEKQQEEGGVQPQEDPKQANEEDGQQEAEVEAEIEDIVSNWNYEGEGDALAKNSKSRDGKWGYITRILESLGNNGYARAIARGDKIDTKTPVKYEGDGRGTSAKAIDGDGNVIGAIDVGYDGTIEHIVVAPDFARKGIATELINQIKNDGGKIDFAKSKQVSPDAAAFFNKLISKQNTPAKQVETLRAEEQAELLKAIPNIEEARVDGEVDRAKLSEADRKTFDKIYDKYDKLITPLLEESAPKKQKTEQEEIDNLPVVEDVPDGAVVEGEIEMKEAVVEEAATKKTEIAEPTTKSIPTLKEGNEATVPLTENVEAKIKVKELPDGELAYSITIERDGQVIEDKDGNTEMEFLTKEEAATHITKKQKGFKLAKQPKTTKPVTVEQVKDTYIEGDEVEFSVFGGTEKGTILPNGRVKSKSGTNYRIGSGIGQATINENLDSAFQKGARQAIKFLDDVDKKLAKQSRETLGMNLPIAIAQSAVKVAKAAIKAGATVANAIEKAIQTVRDSDWYKNLSTKEQTQAEEDVKKLFNAPPKAVPTKAEAKKIVDGAVQQSEEALRSPTVNPLNKKGRQNIVNKLRSWFTDRQGTVKQFVRRMNLPNAEAFLINAKGASGYASKLYEGFHKSIYGGLKSDLAETLDRIIFLRRVVQIDDSRDAAGELRVKHPNNINREVALVELENLKEELGDDKYNSLVERSDAYFDSFREVLKMSYKEGLIDEETYNKFKDNNYQPRKFIKYIFDPNVGESQKNAALQRLARENGVRQEVIKSLADGSTEEIFLDSRFLLQASINSLTKRIAQNKANRKLIDDYNKLSEEDKAEAPEMRQRKPIAKTKQGNLVYPQNPDGYSVVYYYEGGQQKSFFLQDDLYEQWYDFSSSMNSDWEKVISTVSGSRILKGMATGLNPLFIAANIPRDFGHILLFTDAYDSAKVLGVPILPINALKLARDGAKDFLGLIAGNKATTDLLSQAAEDGMLMDFLSIQGKPKGGKVARSVGGARKALRGAADMAAYLGEKSEIAFRLSVYRRQIKELSKEFKKENGSDPQGVDLENIRGRAAAKARSIIDFNQGGTVTKSAEAALPYINAATQGARVAADYITNPKSIKDFMAKSVQAAGFVVMATLYNLSYGEEDWESVPDWEKLRYFIFLLPFKDKDGNREYIRIAKTQQAIPLFNIVEHTTESFIRESRGTDTEASYQMREDRMVESLKEFMPVNPADVASRNPLISASAAYITNYDLYKDRPVTRDFDEVMSYYEGSNDPRIEEFYKAIGRETGMSPARGKSAIEKIITSPTTNPLVGLAYAAGESIVADKDAEKQLQKFAKKTFEGVSRKFYRSTYPEWRSFKEKELVKISKLENATEKRKINKELKDIATGYFLDDKKTQDEKRENVREVIDKVDPEDRKSYVNRFKAYVKGDGLPYDYFNISFEEDAEIQARLFRIKFGPYSRLNAEDKKEIFGNLSKAGMSSPKKMVIKLKRLELEEPVKENRTLIQKMTGQ